MNNALLGDLVLNAGRDLTVKGSNVLSDQGPTLIAQRNVSILA